MTVPIMENVLANVSHSSERKRFPATPAITRPATSTASSPVEYPGSSDLTALTDADPANSKRGTRTPVGNGPLEDSVCPWFLMKNIAGTTHNRATA
jgi:hypothetical protein